MTPKLKVITTNGQAASHQPLSMAVGIPDKKHIPAGAIVTSQSDVENLPSVARSNCHPCNFRRIDKYRQPKLVSTPLTPQVQIG
jgi:hypothetical protein